MIDDYSAAIAITIIRCAHSLASMTKLDATLKTQAGSLPMICILDSEDAVWVLSKDYSTSIQVANVWLDLV